MKDTENLIDKLYKGELYPMEEIYNLSDKNDAELKSLRNRAKSIEAERNKAVSTELLEEYADIHIKIEHIISKYSFRYGIKLGIELARDL